MNGKEMGAKKFCSHLFAPIFLPLPSVGNQAPSGRARMNNRANVRFDTARLNDHGKPTYAFLYLSSRMLALGFFLMPWNQHSAMIIVVVTCVVGVFVLLNSDSAEVRWFRKTGIYEYNHIVDKIVRQRSYLGLTNRSL